MPRADGPPVFSAAPGKFTVVADAAKIKVRGGPMPIVKAMEAAGQGNRVAALEASAAELTATLKLAGKVRSVLRVGGKVLIGGDRRQPRRLGRRGAAVSRPGRVVGLVGVLVVLGPEPVQGMEGEG